MSLSSIHCPQVDSLERFCRKTAALNPRVFFGLGICVHAEYPHQCDHSLRRDHEVAANHELGEGSLSDARLVYPEVSERGRGLYCIGSLKICTPMNPLVQLDRIVPNLEGELLDDGGPTCSGEDSWVGLTSFTNQAVKWGSRATHRAWKGPWEV